MEPFHIGITRDFLDNAGKLVYRDIGLSRIDETPGVEYEFFAEHHSTVPPAQVAQYDGVLSLTPTWNATSFAEGADRLLLVARFGVGFDTCDVAALTAANVLLTITTGATDHAVAGGALAFMLALSRRLFVKDRLVREGRWAERGRYQGTEIGGKTLGIVGLGGAGKRLRDLVRPFGMRVLVYDPFTSDADLTARDAERAELTELFSNADFISVHCPLNDDTRGLIGADLFAQMKPEAYFVNTARGPIVREADLAEALREGRIAGAGIDVFEDEPPAPDNPLLGLDNIILAPHAVCWTHEGFQLIGETAVGSLLSVAKGERPHGLLNPEVWDQPGFQRKLHALRERLAA